MDVSATPSVTVPPAETTAASAPISAPGKPQPVAGPLSQRSTLALDPAPVEASACFADQPPEAELVPASTFSDEVCSLVDDPRVSMPAPSANEEMHRLELPEAVFYGIVAEALAKERSRPLPQALVQVYLNPFHASPKAKAAGGD
jgi:hypothetical protein